jgi:hypothetical protein
MNATTRKTYQAPVITCQGSAVEKTQMNELPPEETADIQHFSKVGGLGFGL